MTRHRHRRPTVILLLALLTITGACGTTTATPTPVSVLGSWTGTEETAFRAVLDEFTTRTGIPVVYQGTRAVNQVLAADVQSGTPPDVAVLSSPGELARYARAGVLIPVDDLVAPFTGGYSDGWQALQRLGTPDTYGVPIKADLKSLVWYPTAGAPSPPGTLADLVTSSGDSRGAMQTWCLGLNSPPASGWTGTDWIEDILVHQAGPDAYRRWSNGDLAWTSPEVRAAWTTWAQVLGLPDNGRAARALLTAFDDSGDGMSSNPARCRMEHLPSFALTEYESPGGASFTYFRFPNADGIRAPSLAGVDMAARFGANPQAAELVRFLASPEGQRVWPARQGSAAFSPNRDIAVQSYPDVTRRQIAQALSFEPLCYDASDVMPLAMSSAFERAVLGFVADPTRLNDLLIQLDEVRGRISRDQWLALDCPP